MPGIRSPGKRSLGWSSHIHCWPVVKGTGLGSNPISPAHVSHLSLKSGMGWGGDRALCVALAVLRNSSVDQSGLECTEI